MNILGEILYYFENICNDLYVGLYIVSRNDVLFYIDLKYNIIKMIINVCKIKLMFIKCVEKIFYMESMVYILFWIEDFLVGIKKYNRLKGNIIWYNRIG